ncbi:SAM hydrolase/SAM-dependent halogenase family protein [Pararhodospirillum oryzae]|uniref:SAM-dependent chlorinase/fluorinase n=1 Tax=Pararhodospirillum oryzae TaxID=478448 RepID=A0A512H4T9_9PROT|nr:SAM-dependent chlorinase/fluorinase [Pararhodospirillum oryzae]GEO80476.1 hypothetical protein ROR02_06070 [Pararhodospirillum oryzae]
MIGLMTDFGSGGLYMGQMHVRLAVDAPGIPCVDLITDLPPFQPLLAAALIPAYAASLPPESVVIAVVDPGVGGARDAIVLRAGGRWYVGPDNGIFALVLRRSTERAAWRLPVPETASPSFHGRDVFAPAAAALAQGSLPGGAIPVDPARLDRPDLPDDPPWVVYIDAYGNAITGVRADRLPAGATLHVRGQVVTRARTFGDVRRGEALFYRNANDMIEIAVNQGRADQTLSLEPGTVLQVISSGDPLPSDG